MTRTYRWATGGPARPWPDGGRADKARGSSLRPRHGTVDQFSCRASLLGTACRPVVCFSKGRGREDAIRGAQPCGGGGKRRSKPVVCSTGGREEVAAARDREEPSEPREEARRVGRRGAGAQLPARCRSTGASRRRRRCRGRRGELPPSLLPRELSLTRRKEGGERTERGGTLPRGARGESCVATDAVSAVWPCGREGEWLSGLGIGS
jgi:hypothetical protein